EAAAFRELLAPVLEHDPVRPHASETRPPFAVMTVSLPPQPFAQAQSAKPVRTLMELQEELNRTRSPFMDRENMDREKGENVVA
ncbi:MAG: hypothetical protein LBC18_10715, partial [Opitutaceae bacterium]|nr:hypothetical protein [Opitutaceae bacterium]